MLHRLAAALLEPVVAAFHWPVIVGALYSLDLQLLQLQQPPLHFRALEAFSDLQLQTVFRYS